MSKISYFTEEGLSKLKNELRLLKTSGRKKIAQQIADARDKGDLSENAEYDAAKEAQGLHELKISKLYHLSIGFMFSGKDTLAVPRAIKENIKCT